MPESWKVASRLVKKQRGVSAITVLGSGGHADTVAEAVSSRGYRVSGLIPIGVPGDLNFGPLKTRLTQIPEDRLAFVLGVGANHVREALYKAVMLWLPTAVFPPVIHDNAWVSPTATLDQGSVVLSSANVGASARLGVGTVLNTGASLDHHSKMEDFSSLAPGALSGGNVIIGARAMIGMQSTILQGRSVGHDSVVGAQSLVTRDISSLSLAFGSPCKVLRSRRWDELHH